MEPILHPAHARLWLVARALALLLAARIALKLLPVARVIAWKQRPPRFAASLTEAAAHQQRQRIREAVLLVAHRSPLHFVCFPQCLAASALLRQQGIASRLHYGVTRQNGRLRTHTWLEAGGEILIGGEVAAEFSELAVY